MNNLEMYITSGVVHDLALSLHSKKVLGTNPRGWKGAKAFLFGVLPVVMWVLSGFPQLKVMHLEGKVN